MSAPIRAGGFALLEVLIAIVVVSVGLLGITTLQTQALRNMQQTHLRNVASEYAIAFSERVRSSAGDEIYLLDAANGRYRIHPQVLCLLAVESMCPGVSSASLAIIRADRAAMDAWVRDGLPQASWGLSLMQNQQPLTAPVLKRCDFSLVSGALASAPCALQIDVTWRALRDEASSSLAYVFR